MILLVETIYFISLFIPCGQHTAELPPMMSCFDHLWYNENIRVLIERIREIKKEKEGRHKDLMIQALEHNIMLVKSSLVKDLNMFCKEYYNKDISYVFKGRTLKDESINNIIEEVENVIADEPFSFEGSLVANKIRRHHEEIYKISSEFIQSAFPRTFDEIKFAEEKINAMNKWSDSLDNIIDVATKMKKHITQYISHFRDVWVLHKHSNSEGSYVDGINDILAELKPISPSVHDLTTSNPVDPINPIDPIDPIDPVDPIDPIDPVDPIDPIDPIDPVDPIDIIASTSNPIDPIDPTDPTASTPQSTMMPSYYAVENDFQTPGNTTLSYKIIDSVKKSNTEYLENSRVIQSQRFQELTPICQKGFKELDREELYSEFIYKELEEKMTKDKSIVYSYELYCRATNFKHVSPNVYQYGQTKALCS